MTYTHALLLATVASAAFSLPAYAQSQGASNFTRDRNVAVLQRVPTGYQALGVKWGTFDVLPKLSLGVQGNDNVFYRENGKGDIIYTAEPSVVLQSNWGRHALSAQARGQLSSFSENSSENTSTYSVSAAGRFDIHGNSNLFGNVQAGKNYEGRFNPSSPASAAKPIEYENFGANAGFIAEGNRLRFIGQVDYLDLDYKDGITENGVVIPQDVRDYSRTLVSGRADYAVSPDTSVYVTYEHNQREYDISTLRDSDGDEAAIGASFDLTNLIRGEVQIGYLKQTYKNPAFKDTKGGSFRAKIEYFPTELMTVTLKTGRSVEETPSVNASGYLSTDTSLSVDHELLRNLVLSGSVGSISDDYKGIDRRDSRAVVMLGGRYLLSRNVSLKASYIYSELKSKGQEAISNYKDNAFIVTVGLQY